MCGIAGWFARDGLDAEEGRRLLDAMGKTLDHRGPDDRGFELFDRCGLVSTRLSIIDIGGGHMPMFNETKDVAVAFNGEIYNHAELRERLQGGHEFATRSDTEPIVHLYEEEGPAACASLAGMFAFALWDARRRRLLLARDRFGIKPLFTARSDDGKLVLFASEAKAILASGRVSAKLDRAAMRDVMTAGYPMPERSMFSGVTQLAPGTWRLLEASGERTTRYWELGYPGSREPNTTTAAAGADSLARAFLDALDAVVEQHLVADVPVGSYLSGGIDSSVVSARAARLMNDPLRTFSMVFGRGQALFDESRHSDLAAQQIGSDHRRVELTGISAQDYVGTIRAVEAPQVHTVAFCSYQLAREVRRAGLKVVLSGEGADELLGGYQTFWLSRLRRRLDGPLKWIRKLGVRAALRPFSKSAARDLLRWWEREGEARARYGLLPPRFEQWCFLADTMSDALTADARADLSPMMPGVPDTAWRADATDPLHRELSFEQATRLDGWVLALSDRLSMAHSVELRVPFLDHRLAEFTASVPPRMLLKGRTEKFLLRHAMRGQLPEALRNRKKRAFFAPIAGWLFGADRPEYVRELLSASELAKTGWFDPEVIAGYLSDVTENDRGYDAVRAAWALNLALSFQVFAREFGVS